MASQYGNNTTPGSGFFFDDTGNSQYWSSYGAFPGGTVTDFYCYVAGDGAGTNVKFAIWGLTALLWSTSTYALGAGTRAVGGQGWQHVGGFAQYIAPQTLNLGLWASGNIVWTFESSGSVAFERSVAGGPTTLASGGTEGSGAFGCYILYTPGQAHVMRNGSWVAGQGSVMRFGTQTQGPIQVMRGGVWTPGA